MVRTTTSTQTRPMRSSTTLPVRIASTRPAPPGPARLRFSSSIWPRFGRDMGGVPTDPEWLLRPENPGTVVPFEAYSNVVVNCLGCGQNHQHRPRTHTFTRLLHHRQADSLPLVRLSHG